MGEVFAGRYEFIDPIGEGGMGTVWRVWDHSRDQLVAAKVLRQSDAGMLVRFVREQALRIAHPHVLMPQTWAGMDDRVLFTMPVVAGGSVATLVGDYGPLPPLLVSEIVRQLLDALAVVHDHRVVHRDVKPANVLLEATARGRPHAYLGDFGIAVDLRAPRWTETGVVTGTPGYLAPELVGGGAPTPATDLYAVGQVALTMLTGTTPGQDSTAREIPTGAAPPLADLITDLLASDPHARPPSARVAADRLAVPTLAWQDEAMGEIEVFDQLPPLPPPWQASPPHADPGPARPAVAPADVAPTQRLAVATPTPVTSHPDAAPLRRGAGTRAAVAVAAVAIAVALTGWWAFAERDAPLTPSGSPSPTGVTASTSLPSATPSATPTAPTPSAPPGSVSVGTVVTSVGQTCDFTQVGLQENTVDGVRVQCVRQDDGIYRWVANPSP